MRDKTGPGFDLLFITFILMMACFLGSQACDSKPRHPTGRTPPESLYTPRPAESEPYNLMNDISNPANPLSPLSPFNPASPVWQPTPSYNGGFGP